MKKLLAILFGATIISSCGQTNDNVNNNKNSMTVTQNDNKEKTADSIYFKSQYFNMLYKHIIKNGKVEIANASSMIGKTMNVKYYVLSFDKWQLKVDKSNRIYFCMQQPEYKHYGNILMTDDDVVKIECQDNVDTKKIYDVYNEILKTMDKEQNINK